MRGRTNSFGGLLQVRELAAARKQLAELQAEAKAADEAATKLEEQCAALREAITLKGADVQRRAPCCAFVPLPPVRWGCMHPFSINRTLVGRPQWL